MPCFACIIVIYGLIKKVPVFDTFLKGAKEGIRLIYSIAPTIMGLIFAVDLLRSSGAMNQICTFVEPIAQRWDFQRK